MKITGIFRIIFFLGCGIMGIACSDSWTGKKEGGDTDGYPVLLELKGRGASDNLIYELCIFRKLPADPDYLLDTSLVLQGNGQDRLRLMNDDLKNYDYRFLFIATPGNRPEIGISGKNGQMPLPEKSTWADTRIIVQQDSLTLDNYYAILDKQGKELWDNGEIEGILTRLVGQMVFDFYKINELNVPVDVDPLTADSVVSVFDRVYQIDITYTGLATAIGFPEETLPVGMMEQGTVVRHIYPRQDERFRVSIPQPENHLYATAFGVKGSARILGDCFLPADKTVRVNMVFHYFDTTPVCENWHGDAPHTKDCYSKAQIALNLPAVTASSGLKILPDCFTRNKGGIYCNRIIDIPHTTGITIDVDWKNTFK